MQDSQKQLELFLVSELTDSKPQLQLGNCAFIYLASVFSLCETVLTQ